MVMSVTEASAAQDVFQLAAGHIREMRSNGTTPDAVVVIDSYRTIQLGQIMAAGQILAEQSYKKLQAGLDGRRWNELIEPAGDDHG